MCFVLEQILKMNAQHKMNIWHAALTILCLLNLKGLVDTTGEATCYKCKENTTDTSNAVPKCQRTQGTCDNNKTTCGVITYTNTSTDARVYSERCLPDYVCANTSNCGDLIDCYIECCFGDLCNNYTSTNVSQHIKSEPPTPTPTKVATANFASATPTANFASATPTAPLVPVTKAKTERPTCANDGSYLSMNPPLLLCILAVCFTTLRKD